MIINIDKIKNKIFNEEDCMEEDCMEEITLSNTNNDKKILKNIMIITKYHSRIHLISYLYLKNLNNLLLMIFIFISFLSGITEVINYNIYFIENDYMIFGIIDVILSFLLIIYKNMNIPNTEQDHYNYHIQYKNLINDVNLSITLYNKPAFIYKNLDVYLLNVINKINTYNSLAPEIPARVLTKYNIKIMKNCKINKSLKKIDTNIKSVNNLYMPTRINEILIEPNNLNLETVKELTKDDIKNYNEFINKIDEVNRTKSRLNNFLKFKDALSNNKI